MTGPPSNAGDFDGAVFDIRNQRRDSMYKGAAVGLFFGLAGWVPGVASLLGVGSHRQGPALIVMAVCAPFLVVGVVLLVSSIQVSREGPDVLAVDARGLTRTSRTHGFDIDWAEFGRIDVVAAQVVPGYDPVMPGQTRGRKVGESTVLRFEPVDPVRFAAKNPQVTTAAADALVQRLVKTPFGTAFTMGEPNRSRLAAALAHFAGPRFGGVLDETAAAQWRRP